MARDLNASMSYGDIRVDITAEGASWNPDIADDLAKRLCEMFRSAVSIISEYNPEPDADDFVEDLSSPENDGEGN